SETPWTAIKDPQFGVAPMAKDIVDDTAHACLPGVINIGRADGSVRSAATDIKATFKVKDVNPDPTTWAWACCVQGKLAEAAPPNGWERRAPAAAPRRAGDATAPPPSR